MPDANFDDVHVEQRLAAYLDRLSCGICIMGADFRLLLANRPFFDIMGYPLAFNVRGTPLERLVEFDRRRGLYGAADPKALYERLCEEARGTPSTTAEWIFPEGRAVEFRRRTAEDGTFVCTVENVTRRKHTAELLESESTIIHHLSDAVAICDFEHRVLEHNPAFARMFGFGEGTARNSRMPPAGFEAEPPAEETLAAIEEGIAHDGRHEFEVAIVRWDSTWFSVRGIVLPRRNGTGDLAGYIAIYRDITSEVRDQRRLQRQDRVIAQLSEAVFFFDAQGRVIDCNRAAERMYGFTSSEFRGHRLCELGVPAEEEKGPDEEVLERLLSGERWTGETHMRTRSGRAVVADVAIQPYYDEAGRVAGIISVHRDVTNRHTAEERLRRQALIIEHMREAAVVTDPSGRIEEMNSSAARIFGGGSRNEIGEAFARQLAEIARSAGEHGHFEGGYALELHDDSGSAGTGTVYCDTVAVAAYGKDGRVAHIVSVHRDVTDRVLRERDLARHQERMEHRKRLEALGQLAGGIAHDFNNILTPILGYAHLASDGLPPDHPARSDLARVIDGMEQARDLVRQILTFGSHMEPPRHPVLLDKAVAEALDLVADSLPREVRLERGLRCPEIAVRGNRTLLRQLVLNLCANAVQAMPEGGRLRVATDCKGDWESLRREQRLSGDRHVRLILSDEGCGIPEGDLARIFDPFFTSKPAGTGLGLSVVHGVVRAHGGGIRIESAPGRGTRFEIYFPVMPDAATLPPPASAPARSGGETILLVDDEADVLDMLRRMLECRGHPVRTAGTGEEAIAVLEANADGVDAVITDLSMPGLGGAGLCRIVCERWPELPVIAMSGRVDRDIVRDYRSWGARLLLHKPVLPRDFEEALAEVLGR